MSIQTIWQDDGKSCHVDTTRESRKTCSDAIAKSTVQYRKETPKPKATPKPTVSVDDVEAERTRAQLARHEETKKRNADTQQLPRNKRRKKSMLRLNADDEENIEDDKKG
ncbi:hypothetical protein ON010_g12348 [Phytophthora cinnamomi]|nr:hypothetical protein ON010_g12348 [Phytophthora cinnamomi]